MKKLSKSKGFSHIKTKSCFKFPVFIVASIIFIFSSFMVASAEMGNNVGSTNVILTAFLSQILYYIIAIIAYFFLSVLCDYNYFGKRRNIIIFAGVILILLLITKVFGDTNGAYAWIYLPGTRFSIQPSEFAKIFMIFAGSELLTKEKDIEKLNNNILLYFAITLLYTVIILFWQKDTGSAVILFVIAAFNLFLVRNNFKHLWVKYFFYFLIVAGIIGIVFMYTPFGTQIVNELASKDYRIARVAASANPFAYEYDYGYHLIMSITSFATGGWFGLGYTNSIHKYMNFPNPSSDFILPVIVEELGFVGFLVLLVMYLCLFGIIFYDGLTFVKNKKGKFIFSSTFVYIFVHFLLNVGGVSGLVPLTGVPLLLVSKGGSSVIACFCAIGLCFKEYYKQKEKNENNSREIQKDAA